MTRTSPSTGAPARAAASQRPPLDAASLAAALGGAVLVTSLFLDWYEFGVSAWTAFELVDLLLLLAGLAGFAALAGVVPRRVLAGVGVAAFVVVVVQLVDQPPAVNGRGLEAGAWLGLAGAALMGVAGILLATDVTFSVQLQRPEGEPPAPAAEPASDAPAFDAPPPPADAKVTAEPPPVRE